MMNIATDDGIRFRSARCEDVSACNAFHNDFYASGRSDAAWRWEFDGWAPALSKGYYIVAESGGRIIGTQTAIPMPLAAMGKLISSAKSEDTLVDQRFRTNRVFARMYDVLNDRMARDQVAVIWGFTPAGKSFQRVGFEVPARTGQIFRVFRSNAARVLRDSKEPSSRWHGLKDTIGSLAATSFGNAMAGTARYSVSGLDLRVLDAAPPHADELSLCFSKRWQAITIHRSMDYLNWRFYENPYVRAQLVGAWQGDQLVGYVAVALPNPRIAMIIDVVAASPTMTDSMAADIVSVLLAAAERIARRGGASVIRSWAVTKHPFDLLVRRVARRRGWLFAAQGHDMVVRADEPFTRQLGELDIDKWYVNRLFTEGTQG